MTLDGADKLRARLKAIGQTQVLLRDIADQGVVQAKTRAQPFSKTRHLSQTIRRGTITETSAEIRAGGQNGVGYAGWVERGTGIYGPRHRPIVPRKAKVLAWRTGVAGGPTLTLAGRSRIRKGVELAGWAFAKSVRGRPATPYLVPGFQQAVKDAGMTTIVRLWDGAA